jgi:hypothetical protein
MSSFAWRNVYREGDRVLIHCGLWSGYFGTVKRAHSNYSAVYYVRLDGDMGTMLFHEDRLRLTTTQRLLDEHREQQLSGR